MGCSLKTDYKALLLKTTSKLLIEEEEVDLVPKQSHDPYIHMKIWKTNLGLIMDTSLNQ